MDDLTYTATLRAAEVSYPRGGRWTLPVFMTMSSLWIGWSFDFYWPIATIWALAVVSAWANAWRLTRRGYPLFLANTRVIVFPPLNVPWREVEELRISAMRHGALLEIVLRPSAPVAYRSLLRQAADIPLTFWSWRRPHFLPAVALPRRNPARYRIPLLHVSQAELRSELSRLLPGIPIVMIWVQSSPRPRAAAAGRSKQRRR